MSNRKYVVEKQYGHEQGLSCTFRQHKAPETHCSQLHGYALAIRLRFSSDTLDSRNWVFGFGDLKEVKQMLVEVFDHKTLVAIDDPHYHLFEELDAHRMINIVPVSAVGCEAFAEMIYHDVVALLADKLEENNVYLDEVEVREHAGNCAIFAPGDQYFEYLTWRSNTTVDVGYEIDIAPEDLERSKEADAIIDVLNRLRDQPDWSKYSGYTITAPKATNNIPSSDGKGRIWNYPAKDDWFGSPVMWTILGHNNPFSSEVRKAK